MTSCFVCKNVADIDPEQSVAICDCQPMLTYHEDCLQSHYLAGNDTCNSCNAKFRVAVRSQIIFSSQRFVTFAKILGKFFFTLPLVALVLFVISPFDWICLFQGQESPYTKIVFSTTKSSWLLFPPKDAMIADIMYMLTVWLTPIISIFVGAQDSFPLISKIWQQRRSYCVSALIITACLLSVQLVLHILGCLHFLFYHSVGVIPYNIFRELRPGWATFCAGPAGTILIGMLILVPMTLLIGIFKCAKYLFLRVCCCAVEHRIISVENKK